MSGVRWMGFAGATATLALALGWSVVSAQTPKKTVDWVAINPAFKDSTFVNDPEKCRECHEPYMNTFASTKHAKAFAVRPPEHAGGCEGCHGPNSKHTVEEDPINLPIDDASWVSICLQCHEGGERLGWKAGPHQSAEVSCISCHWTMQQRSERALTSERALLIRETTSETCYQCHAEVRADMNKMSHHPVREGAVNCASCHNPHGSTPSLLKKNTVNDTCYSCHTEKRGPFLWEHAPARESCTNCHTPHGSNFRNLLASQNPFLCFQCHSYGGHLNLPRYNRVSSLYGSGCTNCHMSVHGSNHPSGAKLTR